MLIHKYLFITLTCLLWYQSSLATEHNQKLLCSDTELLSLEEFQILEAADCSEPIETSQARRSQETRVELTEEAKKYEEQLIERNKAEQKAFIRDNLKNYYSKWPEGIVEVKEDGELVILDQERYDEYYKKINAPKSFQQKDTPKPNSFIIYRILEDTNCKIFILVLWLGIVLVQWLLRKIMGNSRSR